jgi:D-glycero-alpha-D-manno-heptose 1-phosphate guanylyltransferase
MGNIDVVILAGGLGKRLREVVNDRPKVLAVVNGRPFLEIVLNSLNRWRCIDKVILAVGYMSEKILEEYIGCRNYNFEIFFSEERELLGTAGAIKKALKYTKTRNILVLNGDTYVDVNIDDLSEVHENRDAAATIVLKKVENTSRYGSVSLDGDRIVSFKEKILDGGIGYINAGMYMFRRDLFDEVKEDRVLSLEKELLPTFLLKGVYAYISCGKFIDIGTPESYMKSASYLKEV